MQKTLVEQTADKNRGEYYFPPPNGGRQIGTPKTSTLFG
jgi:hypothetical protein